MLPELDIKFDNGNVGAIVPTADGVFGLLASAVAVVDKLALDTPYTIKGMEDVADLGILPDVDNYVLYKWLKEFFDEAGEGAELWLMCFAKDTKPSEWLTVDPGTGKVPAQKLLDAANGRLNGLFTCFSPDGSYVINVTDGVDDDVPVAQAAAQAFALNYLESTKTPIFVILEAYAFDGDLIALRSLVDGSDNRVGFFVGDTKKRTDAPVTNGAASGLYAGRLAKIPVSENPGRVRTGSVNTLTAFIVDEAVEFADIEALHDKGYVSFRTHPRKSGYYFTDGQLATAPSDDYWQISRRRVIDKAYRLAHNIASDEILEDFNLDNDGSVSVFYAKAVEARIEREIFEQMTANDELSRDQNDKDDLGVLARIDTDKDISQTNKIDMSLKVRPRGSARYFEILLGYSVELNN